MEKSLIKERVGKIKQCPNCDATEEYGKFELISYLRSDVNGSVTEEECPSCGAHVIFSKNAEARSISIEELLETNNIFRKMLMICPELNSLVKDYISEKEDNKQIDNTMAI